MDCRICPRRCGADRQVRFGFCGASWTPRVARADLHFWEEPFFSGINGSGAIFFSGCNMGCVFCQNEPLQSGTLGTPMDALALAGTMVQLQQRGAHNINLVTPAPHVLALAKAIPLAREQGLTIPILYNTNAYETVSSLKRMEGLVDIYLPDFKYVSPILSERFSAAPDYIQYAVPAIEEMLRQVGQLALDENGMAVRGLAVRHLVLPNCLFDTRAVLDRLKQLAGMEVCLSLMCQYAPTARCTKAPLNRVLTQREYDRALDYAISCGYHNVTIQDKGAASLRFTPLFTNSQ